MSESLLAWPGWSEACGAQSGFIIKCSRAILKKKRRWPEWWEWELEFTPHLLKRMEDRQFNEVDLRMMLEHARSYQQNIVEGRWVIETLHEEHVWEVIVEPDMIGKLLVVVTAYPVWDD